jgi:uncharacterized membrane-anchored protein YjiN (DUF445 family)
MLPETGLLLQEFIQLQYRDKVLPAIQEKQELQDLLEMETRELRELMVLEDLVELVVQEIQETMVMEVVEEVVVLWEDRETQLC